MASADSETENEEENWVIPDTATTSCFSFFFFFGGTSCFSLTPSFSATVRPHLIHRSSFRVK